MLHRTRS